MLALFLGFVDFAAAPRKRCATRALAVLLTASLCCNVNATTAVGDELTYAAVRHAKDGVHTLTVDPTPFANFGFNTRGFNGSIPGPTFRMDPGDTLEITLVNNLNPANNMACSNGEDFCETATTNLHTHGLHVSSKGKEDGLTYYTDDVFAEVLPGGSEDFKFPIPDYHMPGTHWYHPHHHHATALQAGGGAAGMLIVNDPVGYLPEIYANMPERILMISAHNLQTLEDMAEQANSNLLEGAVNIADGNDLPTNVFLVNGMLGPMMTIDSHVWYRFRMVFAAVEQSLHLTIGETTNGAECGFQLMAKDGIYLHTFPREVDTLYMYPGARSDVAVSCTCTTYPCTALLTSTTGRRLQPGGGGGGGGGGMGNGGPPPNQAGGGAADVEVMLLTIEETANGNIATLPATSVQRPCYVVDLTGATVPNNNRGTLQLDGGDRAIRWDNDNSDLSMTYANVQSVAGGNKYDWPSLTSFTVGQVYEITVVGADAHPFHQHINPYQITTLPGGPYGGGYFQVGDWHDTLLIEEMDGNNLVVREQVDVFTGKQVVHCHILEHEDEGMMGFIDLVGTEGATWNEAETIDATCLRSAFVYDGATQGTTISTESSSSSTSATLGTGGTVEGILTIGFDSGSAQDFVDNFNNNSAEAGTALQTGIASGVDGVEAEDVAITGVQVSSSSRRLGRSLSAVSVEVMYEITVPDTMFSQDVITTLESTAAATAITSSLNQQLTDFTVGTVTVTATVVTVTTSTATATATTTTSNGGSLTEGEPSVSWRCFPGLLWLLLCSLHRLM